MHVKATYSVNIYRQIVHAPITCRDVLGSCKDFLMLSHSKPKSVHFLFYLYCNTGAHIYKS